MPNRSILLSLNAEPFEGFLYGRLFVGCFDYAKLLKDD